MRPYLLSFTALAAVPLVALLPAGAAQARQGTARAQTFEFNLPAQSLARSVTQAAAIGNVQVLYGDIETSKLNAPALSGRMTVDEALSRLLAGSGYSFRYAQPGVVTLVASAEGNADGERVTSAVKVEGTQGSPYFGGAGVAAGVNGINGSRDIGATEGTGSYTSGALSVASKAPQAMKDIPQSVSVITQQRLRDQNINDFNSALDAMTGVSSVQGGNSLNKTFYSRGFQVTSIQVDGGAPFNTAIRPGEDPGSFSSGYFPLIDLSVYDRVEIVRGAAGLFDGFGAPGGTINLARKRPLDHSQVSVEGQLGSWNFGRAVLDLSSPLAFDDKLRGRVVVTHQENDHFYAIASDEKTLIYGVLEYDLTPSTTITGGFEVNNQRSVPFYSGLPRYGNGVDLALPRSTCFCLPWNRNVLKTTEYFGDIQHDFGGPWKFKITANYLLQSSYEKAVMAGPNSTVNPITLIGTGLYGIYNTYRTSQANIDASVFGSFDIFGQRQEITFGANYAHMDGDPQSNYRPLYSPSVLPFDAFHFNPSDPAFREPANSLENYRLFDNKYEQYGIYLNVRFTAFDRFHLDTGVRFSSTVSSLGANNVCYNTTAFYCIGKQIGEFWNSPADIRNYNKSNFSWPPKVGLSYDITRALVAYASYTSIYQDQSIFIDTNGNPLSPVTGVNWEGGAKWAGMNGRLNVSLAGYYIKQNHFGFFISSPPNQPAGRECCFAPNSTTSRTSEGLDLDITGQLTPGWQMSLGYTYNTNEQRTPNTAEVPLQTTVPDHLFKLWTTYNFGKGSSFSGLNIGFGANYQSKTTIRDSICVNYDPMTQNCKTFTAPDYVRVEFEGKPFVVFSGRLGYTLNKNLDVALNLNNILDKIYYRTTSSVRNSNWYGDPRNVMLTISGKW